ncbi:multicopper oxidase family protein [Streptomyces sp. NPDC087658]|uniref:multicopper oxidase family protein n=1 Tax=Streptomyces sp. NPDC087658 TaxID=3365800 RepID=UPI00382EE5D3
MSAQMSDNALSRRDLVKYGVLASAALAVPLERVVRAKNASDRIAVSKFPKPFTVPFAVPPVAVPTKRSSTTDYYTVRMRSAATEILPGLRTETWSYDGTFGGPTIQATRGRPIVVRQLNDLPATHPRLGYEAWTSVHLHGLASLPEYDGYASDVIRPGEYKDYHYPNAQDARTLWYHDHGVHHTAENAYMGLGAMYTLHDELERSLPIPQGRYDVPLIIRDAMFDRDGQLLYDDSGHSDLFGDVILVNGRPWPVMRVERRKYRFRILNAALSRGFYFTLSTGDPFVFIGTDAGLMPQPRSATGYRHGIAERYEVIIDFSRYRIGERVVLKNRGVKNVVDYDTTGDVMAFDVVSDPTDLSGNAIPDQLNPNAPAMDLTEAMAQRTRTFEFTRTKGQWTVNGKTWADVLESNYEYVWADPGLGDVEIWKFVNKSGGWWHPVHTHLIDFRILDRDGRPPSPWEIGGKDTAYVGENETLRVVARFGPHPGRYMLHCHNLVHEDHDMMAQFRVGPPSDEHHPVFADPAKPQPGPELGGDDDTL